MVIQLPSLEIELFCCNHLVYLIAHQSVSCCCSGGGGDVVGIGDSGEGGCGGVGSDGCGGDGGTVGKSGICN